MAQHRAITRKKQLKDVADTGVGSSILAQTMATATANACQTRVAGSSLLQLSATDDAASSGTNFAAPVVMKKARTKAVASTGISSTGTGTAATPKQQRQTRPFLSLDFHDLKPFDPEDFLEKVGGASNLGGGVTSPKRIGGGGVGGEDITDVVVLL